MIWGRLTGEAWLWGGLAGLTGGVGLALALTGVALMAAG